MVSPASSTRENIACLFITVLLVHVLIWDELVLLIHGRGLKEGMLH